MNIVIQLLTVKEAEASEIIVIPCLRMLDKEPNRECVKEWTDACPQGEQVSTSIIGVAVRQVHVLLQ